MSGKFRFTFLLASLLSMLFVSCKKYEDGPFVSLRSVDKRFINSWEYKEYVGYDGATYSWPLKHWIDFRENGFMEITMLNGQYMNTETGSWKFDNKQKTVSWTYVDSMNTETRINWMIKRLKKDELRVAETFDGLYTFNEIILCPEILNKFLILPLPKTRQKNKFPVGNCNDKTIQSQQNMGDLYAFVEHINELCTSKNAHKYQRLNNFDA